MEPDKRVKNLTESLKKIYPCGIKAYGEWDLFKSPKNFKTWLKDWIAGTEGSEQERAVTAYFNLEDGTMYTDTDIA